MLDDFSWKVDQKFLYQVRFPILQAMLDRGKWQYKEFITKWYVVHNHAKSRTCKNLGSSPFPVLLHNEKS